MSNDNQIDVDSLISAASERGDRDGNDAHIESLESLLASACSVLTDEQWRVFLGEPACADLLPQ